MSSSSSILPVSANRVEAPVPPMKDKLGPESSHRKQSSHSRKEYASEKRSRSNVLPPPSKKPPTRQDSGRSGTSKSSTVPRSLMSEIDSGLMLHPNDLKRPRQWNIWMVYYYFFTICEDYRIWPDDRFITLLCNQIARAVNISYLHAAGFLNSVPVYWFSQLEGITWSRLAKYNIQFQYSKWTNSFY